MKRARIKILTKNNLQILGDLRVNLSLNGYCSNVSDLLNNSRTCIDLDDVEVYGDDRQLLAKMPFLSINKPAIACLAEEEFVRTSGSTFKDALADTAT